MPDKNYPTSIRISRELKADLKREAKRLGQTLATLIQQVLKKYAAWASKQAEKAK